MIRKILVSVACLALVSTIATAQIVQPTTQAGADAFDKGADTAAVNQTVTLRVPNATALHLDVTELTFDITSLDGANWPESTPDFAPYMACVYGSSPTDVPMGGGFFSQQQVLPLGTYYAAAGWPNIDIVGDTGPVTAYPPIQFDAEGELVPGSKNHFVCYRSFILQKFSNGSQWDLSVQRADTNYVGVPGALQHVYIQDNPCDTFGQGTGFYELTDSPIRLVPEALGTGPTGFRSARNVVNCGYKSWLDDLVVIAVKVNADYNGDNAAVLQYTLTTTDWW